MNRDALSEALLIEESRWQREAAARLGISLAALDRDKREQRPLIEAKGLTTNKDLQP